tara:strand:- start:5154 stop:5639 length:486 start_codon:yes stop_codon:yes gene_type:complete
MLVDYNSLPNTARVWVYQSDRKFEKDDLAVIKEEATEFINSWTRHGDDLKGGYTVLHNQFLILALDESFANASGCSIDSSVRFIKKIESQLSVDLMNKLNVSFKDGENINIVPLADFQKYAKTDKICSETIVFNNMVQTKGEMATKWQVAAKNSWHQRFLN